MTGRPGRPPRDDLAWLDEAAQLWDQAHADIGYLACVFAQTSLPYRDPGDLPVWQRRNGGLTLTLQPGAPLPGPTGEWEPIGYPFGTLPRLLLAWLTTEAVRTKSRTIGLGESLSDFCRQLELPITGLQIRRLKDQARRLFNARLSVHYIEHLDTSTDTTTGTTAGARRSGVRQEAGQNLLIATRYELWTSTQRTPQPAEPNPPAPGVGKSSKSGKSPAKTSAKDEAEGEAKSTGRGRTHAAAAARPAPGSVAAETSLPPASR
ncbi:replication protein RepA [Kineococcus aurantiacus]|uniref:Uncharacterized protein n=1 Tax=Kineococcus aurantiacus TaxID=37633 RepID=A0A7Y9J3J7_9ACTN|nr:hypothetical protein [Kineococcus aurantiacus]